MVWVLLVGHLEVVNAFLLEFERHFFDFELGDRVDSLLVEITCQGKLFLLEIVVCLGLIIG